MYLSTTFIYPMDMHYSKVHIHVIDLLSLLYTSKYKLDTGAKGSTGFRILKTLIQNPEGEA